MADESDNQTGMINDMIEGLGKFREFPVSKKAIASLLNDGDPDHRQIGILLSGLKARDQEIQKSLQALEDLLLALRVYIKYQEFDLEATRRERDDLFRMLGKDNSDGV